MKYPLPPYAEFLGMRARMAGGQRLEFVLPFSDLVVGRPGYLHGGAIAGLLELAAIGAIKEALGRIDEDMIVKPINLTVNFMRGGTNQITHAAGKVIRIGQRIANVEAHAWQDDQFRPIASAQLTAMLKRPKPEPA